MTNAAAALDRQPEAELLLHCACTHTDSERAERIRALLRQDIDWDHLVQTARRHGVVPLLHRSLNTICPEAVPKAAMDYIQDHYYKNAVRNLFLKGKLQTLLALLAAEGIRAIPFKGPILAASVYGNLGLREFCDLDILVHERDVTTVKSLLESQGYRMQFELNYECVLLSKDGTTLIDLHWELVSREFGAPLDLERAWDRAEPIFSTGLSACSFCAQDLLLLLCVHGSKHCWTRLSWICDVAELIRHQSEIEWAEVLEHAAVHGSRRMLLLGLSLARELVGATLPERVSHEIRADSRIESLGSQVSRHIFCLDGPLAGIEKHRFLLRVRERLRDRVRYSVHLVRGLPECGWDCRYRRERWLLPLPACLTFLYYLSRPIWQIAKHVLSIGGKRAVCFDEVVARVHGISQLMMRHARIAAERSASH